MNRKKSQNKVQEETKRNNRSVSKSSLKNDKKASLKPKGSSKQEQKILENEKIVSSSRRDRSLNRNQKKVEEKNSVSKVSVPAKNKKSQKASISKSPTPQGNTKSSRLRARNDKKQVEEKSDADDSEQNEEEESQSDQVRFKKGAFVAYFDPTADDSLHFKIAKVLKEAFKNDKELQCDIFESKSKGKLEFYQTHSSTCIFDHTIIQEIQVEVLKVNLKKSKATDIYLRIKKVDIKNIENLIPSLLKALKKDSDEDSLSSQEEEEEDEEEEEESEEYEQSQKNKSAKQKGQSQNKQKKETLKKSKKEDEDMKDDDENEEKSNNQDLMQIDSSTIKGKISKVSSQIIQKRKNKKSLDEDQDDEEGPSDEQENIQKRKKLGKSATQVEPRTVLSRKKSAKPKAKKVLTEFKLGVFNPNIQIIEEEPQKESLDKQILKPKCCIRCNNRNVHRAAFTANFDLLKNLTHDKINVSRLSAHWGPDDKITPLDILIQNGDPLLLELVLKPNIKLQRNEIYQNVLNEFYTNRAYEDPFLINFVDSGTVSRMAYGAYVRSVEMTRGSRQGNNAFLENEDQDKNLQNIVYSYNDELPQFFKIGDMTVEKYKTLEKLKNNAAGDIFQSQSSQFIDKLIRIGEYKVSAYILKDLWALSNFGFNKLHYLALCPPNTEPLSEFKSVSVVKKAQNNKNVTPLHFACINPHPEILKQLLNINSDINIQDFEMRKPIHYAAACENSDNLQTLIDMQANLSDIDMKKVSCLHIAAQAGRAENMKFILIRRPQLLKLKDRQGMDAMAYSCENQNQACIDVLLQHGAKINNGVGKERMTPLHYAASRGNFDLCDFLIEKKAKVNSKDKFKRSPLVMAVRNGHLKVASLLLSKGADWNQGDSSSNAPLHYAAAYGWQDCIDLLLKAGADINAQTSWKITPINIAMLKNHEGCVKKFLEHPEVDVNCKDEKGRTLLTLSLLNLREGTYDFIKFLLEKGADPNLPDAEQATSLHYLAKYQASQGIHIYPHQPIEQQEKLRAQIKRKLEIQLEIADLLIQKGASLTLRDSEKRTPFSICLANHNEDLLKKLLEGVTVNNDPEIFHQMKNYILNIKYQQILREVIENETPKVESINILDDIGMTPFLAYIDKFCSSFEEIRSNIFKILVSDQGKKKDFDIKQITNEKLFDEQYLQMFNPTAYNHRNRKIMPAKKAKSYLDENVDNETDEELKETQTQEDSIENTDSKVKSILDDQVIKPFIELLQYLIMKKADPHAQVQKLKRFRELEEIRRLQQEGVQNGQITEQISQLQKVEERAKKREEVLKERESRKFKPKRAKKAFKRGANHSQTETQKIKDNKKEQEYDHLRGLQNAFHLAVKCPHQKLIQFLEKYKVNADAEDHQKTTPLNLLSSSASNRYVDPDFQFLIEKLISLKVRLDFPDIKGRTPFLNFYGSSNTSHAEKLLGLGANVNQMDTYGLYALKYAMIRRSSDEIYKLTTTFKANINQIDGKGRNLLHHAINMSSSTADATFDIEQVLIDLGININLRDQRKRTPLHYAFVKMKKWNDTIQIDPIETVSSLCGCKGLEIDVPDQWLKTPLHYASQRGASICAMYLQKRGADLESVDIYGNTPLGVGIISKHFNYGIILIQKNADVTKLVHHVDPKKAEQIFKQDEAKKDHEMGDNGEMTVSEAESESDDDNLKAKHRKIFDRDPNKNYYYGSEDESEDESDQYDDSDDNYEQNVFNQQNAFGLNFFNNKAKQNKFQKSTAFGQFGLNNNQIAQQPVQEKNEYHEPRSMFRLSINFGQLGLAYLMLDQGYNLMKAMQDALDEKKFLLVLTFLGKNPDDSIIRQKNEKNQNLFHILSQNASSCRVEHLKKIYNALRLRGVNCLEQDGYGRTALHYAVESRNRDLVLMLLEEGADPAILDMYGYSPLIMYLKGKSIKNIPIYNQRNGDFDLILKSLIERGANVNQKYTENSLKSIYFQEVEYETSPIINYVRQHLEDDSSMTADQQEKFINGFIGLVLCGSRFDILDSDNCDVLIHTIRHNHTELFNLIIAKSKKSFLVIDNQDVQGRSAIHHVVNPRNFGSYENVYMIEELFKLNYQLQLQDSQGKEPFVYALQQKSGKLRQKIAHLTQRTHFNNGIQRKISGIPLNEWQQVQVQAEEDSEYFMKEAQEKEDRELQKMGEQKIKELVPVDKTGRFEKSYRVFCENNKPWDVYLTKVDLKNGLYGDYVFYKIQLLYDQVRDLYVVFTRYGRIGEDGMNQRTPFNKLEDAKKEFCSIFKSKTGNEFQIEDLSHFQRQNKKYNLSKVTYSTVQHKDYLAPFDFEKCAKSKLDKQTRTLLEEVANITMYQRAMNQMGIDTSILPLSNINKQTVTHAMDILKQLSNLIQEDQAMQKKGIKDIDYDLYTQGKDKIVELSSKFYELIPLSRYKDKAAPPISYPHQIQQAFSELECLVNIEHASKILLGALYRQQEMHPVDYVYAALNIIIQFVDPLSEEHQTIQQYVQNTNEGSINFDTHKLRVFRVHRKGESENISNFDSVPNHRLLFHGSQLFNFLGILSQGLRIAPPEAPPTGYMFGKGIYFADAFCKSIGYAQKTYMSQQDSNLLLLCQVVLGKQKKLWQPEYVESLASNFHSVHGVGKSGPDYKKILTLENGVELPFGKMTEYKDFDPELANVAPQPNLFGGFGGRAAVGPILQHNEFIVYNQSQVKMRYLLQIVQKSKEELSSQK